MSDSTSPKKTVSPAQSHEEIQKLLRAEIEALQDMLGARFAEIATLTKRLQEIEVVDTQKATDVASDKIAQINRRHAVELALVHAMYASFQNGPAEGVPSFSDQIDLVRQSDFFNPTWYLTTYSDVAGGGTGPAEHYVRSGAFEGRNPGPNFDTMGYYIANSDIAATGWPALVHYEAYGKAEGRLLR